MEETSAVNGINKDNPHVFELDVCTILKVNPGEGDVADTYDVSFDELDGLFFSRISMYLKLKAVLFSRTAGAMPLASSSRFSSFRFS